MKAIYCKYALILLASLIQGVNLQAQQVMGSHGLLNTPDAQFHADGSMAFGINYIPSEISPAAIKENSMNYYASISFLPFLELTYRCTILDPVKTNHFFEHQDRSIGGKLKILNEKQYLPAIALGSDDFYTTVGKGNKHFSNAYIVVTKSNCIGNYNVELSLGYGFFPKESYKLKGLFGGMALSHKKLKHLSIMIDYDSKNLNSGMGFRLLKHINLYGFFYQMKYLTGGIELRFTLGE